jgi:gliding motility-associated-like protein
MVIARSSIGCIDTASVRIAVDPLGDIYIPSAFTPNGDGKNDVFRILGGQIRELDFRIYNRWGEVIFASRDRTQGWDGRYKGKLQPNAVYVYFLKAILQNGATATKKGTVTLIK